MSLASWFRNLFASASAKPKPTEVGRNDFCWCGSGKKYKKCHLKSDELKRVEARYAAQLSARNKGPGGVVPSKGGKAKQRLEKAAEPGGKR